VDLGGSGTGRLRTVLVPATSRPRGTSGQARAPVWHPASHPWSLA